MIMDMIIQMEIRDSNFTTVCQYLRNGQANLLTPETQNLLADHLEGKIKRKRGPRFSIKKYERNKEAWEFYQNLRKQGYSYEEAIAEMGRMCEMYNGGGKEAVDYEGRIRSYLNEYKKVEKEVDNNTEN